MVAYKEFLFVGFSAIAVLALVMMVIGYVLIGRMAKKSPESEKSLRFWKIVVVGMGCLLLSILAAVFVWLRANIQ